MVEFLRNFLTGAIWTAITLAWFCMGVVLAVNLLIILPEKISKKIHDWRHRKK